MQYSVNKLFTLILVLFFFLGRRLLFEAKLNAINLWKVEWNEVQRNIHNTAMVSDGQMFSPSL